MFSKAIVSFVLLTAAIAERPRVALRVPIFPPISPQVVGGEEAPVGGYPFIVSLQMFSYHFCAGSILNERWIITSGACVHNQTVPSINLVRVKAGKHDIVINEDDEQTVQVEKAFVHENYQGGVGPYDIALLKLASPLKLTKRVQPVRLATSKNDPRGEAWFCGWGSTSTSDDPNRPDKLQHVKMVYIGRATCYWAVMRLIGSCPIDKTNICTGSFYDQISTCSGDSGGPLISYYRQRAVLTGIVSWHISPCGDAGAPSIFTKVSVFFDWIREIIYNN